MQYQVKDLLPLGIIFVVLGIALSVGALVLDNMYQDGCDGTWYTTASPANASVSGGSNPVTGGYWGCCTTTNASASSCVTWTTDNYRLNITQYSTESIDEVASWLPTVALIVVAAIIIGILVGALYLQFKGGL